eukprot:2967438-Heterocapsa_arctica.AAC.1
MLRVLNLTILVQPCVARFSKWGEGDQTDTFPWELGPTYNLLLTFRSMAAINSLLFFLAEPYACAVKKRPFLLPSSLGQWWGSSASLG